MVKKKQSSKKTQSFEESLAELQALVESMEKGEISLEESLEAFERGVELTRHCQAALMNAEQKIQILSENGKLLEFQQTGNEEETENSA